MKRVSKSEAASMRDSLTRWHSVSDMQRRLHDMAEPVGFYAVSQRAMQFWREAFCACRFAIVQNASAVRLSETDPPDFELKIDHVFYTCELVEVRDPASLIGDEFDALAERFNAGLQNPPESLDTEDHLRWLPDRLANVISDKARKGYPSDVTLAVYIHAWIFDSQRPETDETIWRTVAPHLDRFESIWVLSSGCLLTFSAKQP